MSNIRDLIVIFLTLFVLTVAAAESTSGEVKLVPVKDLTLGTLIDSVLENYPGYDEIPARLEEAGMLDRKSRKWISSAPSVGLRYQTGQIGNNSNLREYEAGVALPLWRLGERRANKDVAREAGQQASTFDTIVRWQLAGALRTALWQIELASDRVQHAENALAVSADLLHGVQRRVDLGDLALGDLLQAQQDEVSSQLRLLVAQTEYVNAAQAYRIITGIEETPATLLEQQSIETGISDSHPALANSLASLARANAEYDVERESGVASPALTLGVRSERGGDDIDYEDSVGVFFSYPFGGGAHLDAQVATAQVQVAAAKTEHRSRRMQLALEFQTAERNLVSRKNEKLLAAQRSELAQQHLRMSQTAFELGDIGLLEFLFIKDIGFNAESEAREKEILWRSAISSYNQAVGDIP